MKNGRIFILSIFIIILIPVAQATSGACSWHGGVDCEAGKDWDGSVICNDGWRDSTVPYEDMVMCSSTEDPFVKYQRYYLDYLNDFCTLRNYKDWLIYYASAKKKYDDKVMSELYDLGPVFTMPSEEDLESGAESLEDRLYKHKLLRDSFERRQSQYLKIYESVGRYENVKKAAEETEEICRTAGSITQESSESILSKIKSGHYVPGSSAWKAMYKGGKATPEMIEAYNKWKIFINSNPNYFPRR